MLDPPLAFSMGTNGEQVCLIKDGLRIGGIRWTLPPGVYGP
jgi:hypothetical protein